MFSEQKKQLDSSFQPIMLSKIREIIQQSKAEHQYAWDTSWTTSNEVSSAMRDAILVGDMKAVNLLLDEGVCAKGLASEISNSIFLNSYSYIYFAIISGNLGMVKLLVERDVSIVKQNDYDNPLSVAVKTGHFDIVKYLLKNGAVATNGDIGHSSSRKDSLIAHAAKHDRLEILDLLIQFGADKMIESSFVCARHKYSELLRQDQEIRDQYNDETRNQLVNKLQKSSKKGGSSEEKSLKDFDEKKIEFQNRLTKHISEYDKIVRYLMDYAIGYDFSLNGLNFFSLLQNKNVAGINFIGVSVGGHPVTKEMLLSEKLEGVDEAILTRQDLQKINDTVRRQALKKRLKEAINLHGELMQDNLVNLIPLWRAAEIGNVEAVKSRLKAGTDPNQMSTDRDRNYPIVLAAKNNHEEIIDILMAHPTFKINTLPIAVKAAKDKNHNELADKLVSLQNVDQQDDKGDTLLHHAIRAGKVDEVKKLIEKGANVNLCGNNGYPLAMAAEQSFQSFKSFQGEPSTNHIEILKILLANHADPNLVYYGKTAADAAWMADSAEALALLLPITNKVDIQIGCQVYPWYTRMMFSSLGYGKRIQPVCFNLLKVLKENGANFNQKEQNDTLLYRAMFQAPALTSKCNQIKTQDQFSEFLKLIDYLLENGSDPTIKSTNGDTPLHYLLEKENLDYVVDGYARIIAKCLARGFDINSINNKGQTLLHIAVKMNHLNAVEYLLAKGANTKVMDENGKTPFDYASEEKILELKSQQSSPKQGGSVKKLGIFSSTQSSKASVNLNQNTIGGKKIHKH